MCTAQSALITGANTGMPLQRTLHIPGVAFFCSCPTFYFIFAYAVYQLFTICRNAGIGYETALALASKGYATVLACRDNNKAAEARDRIRCTGLRPGLATPMLPACLDVLGLLQAALALAYQHFALFLTYGEDSVPASKHAGWC